MGKKKVFEVAYGKGRGVRKVLVDSKRSAEKMRKDLVSSGLFKSSEFRIKSMSVTSGNGLKSMVKGLKRRVKKRRKKK